ncbi:MAG: FAD-dependent oxidoreductase [Thermoplasmata archaeon]
MKVLIIGGDAAGMSAASKIKRINKDTEVTVFEKGNIVSYSACGIPYYIEGIIKETNLVHYPIEKFTMERGINVKTKSEVINVNTEEKTLTYTNENEIKKESYDKLIISSGATPKIPSMFKGYKNVFSIRNLEDAIALKNSTNNAKKILVIGAGYIGIEMAEAWSKSNKEVTIVSHSSKILGEEDENFSILLKNKLLSNGIKLKLNVEILSIQSNKGIIQSVTLNNGEKIETENVLIATGIVPNTSFLKDSNVNTLNNAIIVNEKMETNVKDVYAAGDCTISKNVISGTLMYHPTASIANKEGRVAGSNAANSEKFYYGHASVEVVKVFDLEYGVVGINEKKARELNFKPVSNTIKTNTRARYYPDNKELYIKMIADERSLTLLGASIIGGEGVAIRIDVLASAMMKKYTLNDIMNIDFSYSPSFSPAWEPLYVAADVLSEKIKRGSKND